MNPTRSRLNCVRSSSSAEVRSIRVAQFARGGNIQATEVVEQGGLAAAGSPSRPPARPRKGRGPPPPVREPPRPRSRKTWSAPHFKHPGAFPDVAGSWIRMRHAVSPMHYAVMGCLSTWPTPVATVQERTLRSPRLAPLLVTWAGFGRRIKGGPDVKRTRSWRGPTTKEARRVDDS